MPSYLFEITTAAGVERLPFTIDHDRVLGPQVTQVLEELRQRGVILQGTHSDHLGVYWMGRELDLTQQPGALGLTPARPIELRMRAAVTPDAPADTSLPRGVSAAAMLGYVAGVIAWVIITVQSMPAHFTTEYHHLDQVTMAIVGAIVGGFTLGGAALRARGVVLLGVVAGVLLGGGGAFAGATAALALPGGASVRGFLVARVAGWALAAGGTAVLLAGYFVPIDPRRVAEALAIGLVGGAMCGVVFVLPGPSDLWQGIACVLFGVVAAVAACGPTLWRAAAIVELVPTRGAVPGILSLREWALQHESALDVDQLKLGCQRRRVALYPPAEGLTVDGRHQREPAFLDADRQVTVGGAGYRVHLLRDDG